MKHGLKGKVKLGQHLMDKNDYWIYDDNGFICGSLGNNEEKMKELINKVNNSIELKNIDLTGITSTEQSKKVIEEEEEFKEAFAEYINYRTQESRIHLIDETLDEFQSKLGLLEKEGIKAEEVQAYYSAWVKKLENRPRIKECKKCFYKINCCLYLSERWDGEHEAEKCRVYKESEEQS